MISDNKKVRKHILPLFFTVISEMLDINAHRNWIHADVRHMMKHQEIYVYYRAATDYIGNIGWDRLERYMQRQYLVRRLGGNLKGKTRLGLLFIKLILVLIFRSAGCSD